MNTPEDPTPTGATPPDPPPEPDATAPLSIPDSIASPVEPAASTTRPEDEAPATLAIPAAAEPAPPSAPRPISLPRSPRPGVLAEPPETTVEIPRRRLSSQSRRDFLLFAAGVAATATGAWWLLPDRTRMRLLPATWVDRLDTLASRVGLSRDKRERTLDRALTFDDDVSEALYSKQRRVRTYRRSQITSLRNNYDGQTPGPEYLPAWRLELSGLQSGATERFPIGMLLGRFPLREQITRLVCVEGWSAIAWWGGIRFADLLAAFPPAPGARWAAMRSGVNLDARGNSDPYYVSIDLDTARHPQTLLATHHDGRPLTLAHGAPMRLLAPMKLGLKNIKAVTHIAYTANEPADYWNERGYSRYDGL